MQSVLREMFLAQVSVSGFDDSVVWGVTTAKSLYKLTGRSWEKVNGQLDVVSCGESGLWGVFNPAGIIWYRLGTYGGSTTFGTGWKQVDGLLNWISSGAAGEVWGVDKKGNVLRREGITGVNPTGTAWKKMPESTKQIYLKQVSIWAGQVWAVNSQDQIFYMVV